MVKLLQKQISINFKLIIQITINLEPQNLQNQFSDLNNIETIAIRPQHVSITDESNYDLDLEIFGIENLGKELIIIYEYNNDKIRIINRKYQI